MAYDRRKHLGELNRYLGSVLHDIEQDEKEIRRIQDRLRQNIAHFRSAIIERDAIEAAGLEAGEIQ